MKRLLALLLLPMMACDKELSREMTEAHSNTEVVDCSWVSLEYGMGYDGNMGIHNVTYYGRQQAIVAHHTYRIRYQKAGLQTETDSIVVQELEQCH